MIVIRSLTVVVRFRMVIVKFGVVIVRFGLMSDGRVVVAMPLLLKTFFLLRWFIGR